MAIRRALLLIADIGGYTRFMRVHRINLAHAQDVITRLLEAVIDGATGPLRLAKLEGDAAFFHATLPSEPHPDELAALAERVQAIRASFIHRRERMSIDRICTCDGCTQVGELRLKFIAHTGEIAYHRVKGRIELAGMPVIVLHRLLKNSVPVPEYMLMTGPVLDATTPALRDTAQALVEDLEGLGRTTVYYVDLTASALPLPPPASAGPIVRMFRHILLNLRSLPYMLGVRKACEGFRNMGEALGELAAPPAATLPPRNSPHAPALKPPAEVDQDG